MDDGNLVRLYGADSQDVLVKSFERHLKAMNRSPNTIAHYKRTLKMFTEFLEEQRFSTLWRTNRKQIEIWLVDLHKHYKPHSVRSFYRSLRAFYGWMVKEEEVKRSPMERMDEPAVEEAPKDIVAPADLARMLAKLEKEKRWRDAAVIAIFYDAGIRASELADCRTENVNMDAGLLFIPHAKGKRVRTVHLGPRTIQYLDRYRRKPVKEPEWLINGRMGKLDRTGIYRIVVRCFAELGLEVKIGAHDLRHTSASHHAGHMGESEMMALFGWQDASMARHYAKKALEQSALAAHKRSGPMDRLPKPKA